jgi:activator of HSP90 ATPase
MGEERKALGIICQAGCKVCIMGNNQHTVYSLSLKFFVHAPPDEVMELLLNPEFIKDWSGADALVEKKVGGKFMMFDGWVEGKILKITADELAYTWKPSGWSEETAASEVDYKLVAVEHGTEVMIEHTNFPNEEEMESHKTGWEEHFFGPIGEYLANRNL